jgi:6-phosphofructokinase 2
MAHILTITMNPAIDISTSVGLVQPFRKLRCGASRRDPGGGGINVARVVNRLGSDVTALYPAGGFYGQLLRNLLDGESIRSLTIPIDEETREDFTVEETTSGNEYRFVSTGPLLQESEWRACLEEIAAFREPVDMIVASGTLPPGVPEDFYARVAKIARARSAPFTLDTSGPPLRAALEQGVDFLKPSLREMRELTGEPLADPASCIAACRSLVTSGKVGVVALTLGSQGAILVTKEAAWRAWPLPIKAVSTVGAGDSFLAAMVFALTSGRPHPEAFAHGVAAGSAALLSPGTQLCHPDDMRELLTHVVVDRAGP